MKHFDISEWVDFVRDLVPERRRQDMARHLDTGCARCTKLATLLRDVSTAARVELASPPSASLRLATALFVPRPTFLDGARLLARLVFDSAKAPLPVGIRSGQAMSRQVLYRAGEFDVDLRLEYDAVSPRVALVGQIANRLAPTQPVADVPVTVTAGSRVVAQTTASATGEFQLEYQRQPRMRLRVPMPAQQRWIDLSLPTLESREASLRVRRQSGRRRS